jgi:hypothetical protein
VTTVEGDLGLALLDGSGNLLGVWREGLLLQATDGIVTDAQGVEWEWRRRDGRFVEAQTEIRISPEHLGNWFEAELNREGVNYLTQRFESNKTNFFVDWRLNQKTMDGEFAVVRADGPAVTDYILQKVWRRMRTTGDFSGDWGTFVEYLQDGGKLILSDISLLNLATGKVDYFDHYELTGAVTLLTDHKSREPGEAFPFTPRFKGGNIGGTTQEQAYDPSKPGILHFVVGLDQNLGGHPINPVKDYVSVTLYNLALHVLVADAQWERYGSSFSIGPVASGVYLDPQRGAMYLFDQVREGIDGHK